MPEYLACLGEPSFSVAAADYDLGSYAESESDHEQHHIIYDGDGGRTKLHFAYSSQKCRIRQSDHLLHDKADKDRIGYLPDVSI